MNTSPTEGWLWMSRAQEDDYWGTDDEQDDDQRDSLGYLVNDPKDILFDD